VKSTTEAKIKNKYFLTEELLSLEMSLIPLMSLLSLITSGDAFEGVNLTLNGNSSVATSGFSLENDLFYRHKN
jgi:hypothetical protein